MTIATDTPEIITEDVNSPIEAFILDKGAGQGEYAIDYPKTLLPDADAKEAYATEAVKEAGAGGKETYVTEAVKETHRRKPVSMVLTSFRWLETIPYLNIIIGMLKKLKIPTLKRPKNHTHHHSKCRAGKASASPSSYKKDKINDRYKRSIFYL